MDLMGYPEDTEGVIDTEGLPPEHPITMMNEPRRPHRIREWRHAPWLAVFAVCLGALMSQLNSSIVIMAYPTMERTFNVPLGSVTWVGLSYLLTLVSTLILFGRISDMVGRKLIYIYGFVVFILGSILCGLAPSLGVLVASRVVQALGGSMLQANSVAIVFVAAPLASRTKALGFQAAAQALGLALGPTLGGVLIGAVSWRWLFLINVPIGMVSVVAAILFIPRSRNLLERKRLDWPGVGLLVLAVASILVGLSFAKTLGWGSPLIVSSFLLTALAVAGFVVRERHAEEPLLNPEMIAPRSVSFGLVAACIAYLVLFGFLLIVPYEIERGFGMSAGRAGLDLLALPLALGLASPFAGRVARSVGSRWTALSSGVLASLGALVVMVSSGTTWMLVVGLSLVGIGIGIFNTVNNSGVMGAIPTVLAGIGSGVLNTVRGLGTALGLAGAGAAFVALGGADQSEQMVRHAFSWTSGILGVLILIGGLLAARAANGEVVRRPSGKMEQ